jgi:hypothetical protein
VLQYGNDWGKLRTVLRAVVRRPAFVDPTRPTTAVAAFPGGVVPDDLP